MHKVAMEMGKWAMEKAKAHGFDNLSAQDWRSLLKDGTKPEDARLRILALSNMALRPLSKIIQHKSKKGW